MTNRAACMGVALIVSLICGSIANTAMVFAGAAVIIIPMWLVIDRLVPHDHG
jgi:hypothetical protein